MHEVSIMQNLLRVVEKTVEKEGGSRVDEIHLKIGEMSGVNVESLRFAFEVLSKGTPADGGRLDVENVPLHARCRDCSHEFHPEEYTFRCPKCGGTGIEIISGREMEIDYILIDEEKREDS